MGVIDFTGMPKRNKAYAGANGKKISVLYDGEQYMTLRSKGGVTQYFRFDIM